MITLVRAIHPPHTLPLAHVAGAALIGLFGWEVLVYLPGTIAAYASMVAGIGGFEGVRGHQAFVVGQAAFVIGAALAVVGILRRRAWAVVLGSSNADPAGGDRREATADWPARAASADGSR